MARQDIIVDHWFFEKYGKEHIVFWKNFKSIAIFVVLMFFSFFQEWIEVLNFDMSKYDWAEFISISFMICFSLDLDHDKKIGILHLAFDDHPRA